MSYSCKRSKVFLEEIDHMLFRDNKACKEVFTVFSIFLKDLLQSEDLVHGAATWTKTALSIH